MNARYPLTRAKICGIPLPMHLRQAQRRVVAPYVYARPALLPVGARAKSGEYDVADFVYAIENLAAEIVDPNSESPYDDDDDPPPNVLGSYLASVPIPVLRSALDAMRFFLASMQNTNPSTKTGVIAFVNRPPTASWSLKSLERFFREGIRELEEQRAERISKTKPPMNDVMRLDDRMGEALLNARLECIRSSLLCLEAVCGLLLTAPTKYLNRSAQND